MYSYEVISTFRVNIPSIIGNTTFVNILGNKITENRDIQKSIDILNFLSLVYSIHINVNE